MVMYEFIEYSKERLKYHFIAINLFPNPVSEFIDFAADIASALLFFALFNIIETALDILEVS